MSHLREADTLVVWKLDRLGRSVKGLVDLVNELEARKVHFQSITDGVDTKTPAGLLLSRNGESCPNGARTDRCAHIPLVLFVLSRSLIQRSAAMATSGKVTWDDCAS
jgi:hypothetical protein